MWHSFKKNKNKKSISTLCRHWQFLTFDIYHYEVFLSCHRFCKQWTHTSIINVHWNQWPVYDLAKRSYSRCWQDKQTNFEEEQNVDDYLLQWIKWIYLLKIYLKLKFFFIKIKFHFSNNQPAFQNKNLLVSIDDRLKSGKSVRQNVLETFILNIKKKFSLNFFGWWRN